MGGISKSPSRCGWGLFCITPFVYQELPHLNAAGIARRGLTGWRVRALTSLRLLLLAGLTSGPEVSPARARAILLADERKLLIADCFNQVAFTDLHQDYG